MVQRWVAGPLALPLIAVLAILTLVEPSFAQPSLIVVIRNAEHVTNELKIVIDGPMGKLTFEGRTSVTLTGVLSGVYAVTVYWRQHLVAAKSVAVNVENVVETIELPFFDFAMRVVDLNGGDLPGPFTVRVEPRDAFGELRVVDGSLVLINAVRTLYYTITVEWESLVYQRRAQGVAAGYGSDLMRRGVITVPVGDVTVSIVDQKGRGLGGAVLSTANARLTTADDGVALLRRVPLESAEGAVSLPVTVSFEGHEVASQVLRVSREVRSFTVTASVYDLNVAVFGSNEQPLSGAKVSLLREGVEVGLAFSDEGGLARLSRVIPVRHFLRVEYKGADTVLELSPELIRRGTVEARLPVFIELGGAPLSFEQLLALIIVLVMAVLGATFAIAFYIRRRSRKLLVRGPIFALNTTLLGSANRNRAISFRL
ncbi:MAG: hypothetical protein NZ988_02320 [Thaumarchaeota archaeon]|nr:hypothetical protein [Candidatus Calditenuaceae archaeon]MDW8186870.1 hypothetical protein [Nitrososphaerota archaeon]